MLRTGNSIKEQFNQNHHENPKQLS